MAAYFNVKGLTVGYDGNALIHDIDFSVARGDILTLIARTARGNRPF
jgi:ABC-type branched-subunit amino acid transport system ATPase component